jgi:hypothetical protein
VWRSDGGSDDQTENSFGVADTVAMNQAGERIEPETKWIEAQDRATDATGRGQADEIKIKIMPTKTVSFTGAIVDTIVSATQGYRHDR